MQDPDFYEPIRDQFITDVLDMVIWITFEISRLLFLLKSSSVLEMVRIFMDVMCPFLSII